MSASNKTITIRQGCRYAWREWNIFWKLSPKFFYATFASAALTALSPYATVWLSAQLVGELSGGRDPHRLMVWVLWTLGTTAVLTLLRAAAFHWKEAETDDLWRRQTRTYMDKQMSLDYVDEDSQRVYDMYSQIQQDARLSGAGGTICILLVEKIATALFQILGGVVLCWGLFTAAVPDGRLAFLGHPLFLAAFWAVMVCTACLSPVFAGQAAKYMPLLQESGKLGNRMFHVQLTLPEEPKNAPDLRMYDQYQNVVSGYMVGLWGCLREAAPGRDGDLSLGLLGSVGAADGAGLSLRLPQGLRRGVRSGCRDAVPRCGRQPVPGRRHPCEHAGRDGDQRRLYEKHLRLPRPAQQHVSGQPDHRKAERPPVYGGVPGCLLPLPRQRAVRPAPPEHEVQGRRAAGRGGDERQRQNDLHQAALPPVRPYRGSHPVERDRHPEVPLRRVHGHLLGRLSGFPAAGPPAGPECRGLHRIRCRPRDRLPAKGGLPRPGWRRCRRGWTRRCIRSWTRTA